MIGFIDLEEVTELINLEKENQVWSMIETKIDVEVVTPLLMVIRNQQIKSRSKSFKHLRIV